VNLIVIKAYWLPAPHMGKEEVDVEMLPTAVQTICSLRFH